MDNFNKPLNRNNTSSFKWDYFQNVEKSKLIPFSIADSDYQTAEPIINHIIRRALHGAFGYTFVDDEYREIIENWVFRRYNYQIEKQWIVPATGVVTSMFYQINLLTEENDYIVIQPPVYHPFYQIIEDNNRRIALNKLISIDNTYLIDYEDLENHFINGAKMLIFCSPHNPVGRVWKYEEVENLVNLCKKYDVTIISDEIHCDLILGNNEFFSVGKLIEMYDKMIICTAPSKTFNLAGLHTSNMFIPNKKIRYTISRALASRGLREPNVLGIEACKAAYRDCDEWLEEQISHIEKNYQFLLDYFNENIPKARIANLEGTYLVWIDMKFLNISSKEMVQKLVEYGIIVNSGIMYGKDYDEYIRINIACSKQQLLQGLEIINKFVKDREI